MPSSSSTVPGRACRSFSRRDQRSKMPSSSRILIHLLALMMIVLMVDGSLQESAEEQRRKERELNNEIEGIAIDVEYKNGSARNSSRYRNFVDVALLSSGFIFVAVAFLVGMLRLSTRKTVNYETIV